MKRTVVNQLAMVNWKGVFYERYLFDRGVTALEGVNGSGKTTVMIAAYVVLLPDKRFLRFDPLTQSGARSEDRGIWGRVGDDDDAYSALDFRLGNGDRLLAGVRLVRKAANAGELHPFLIKGLPPDAPVQHLLLDRVGEEEEVPAADRLAQLAALAGGQLTWSESVSSYLKALFELGVTPMPMSSDAERAKLNDLLRTSMMGGISQNLGRGLRSFLLRPEEGLGQTLRRIRANLDECRRTRMQVKESRQLEKEIHEVLDAGAHMFAAAVEGTRRLAQERHKRALEAAKAEEVARDAQHQLLAKQEAARAALERAEAEETQAKDAAELARDETSRVERANRAWEQRLAEQEQSRHLEAVASEAAGRHQAARIVLEEAERLVRSRERDHQDSAKGMADIQAGLERLHTRASRYRAVQAALQRARALLPRIEFSDAEVSAVLERCEREAESASKMLVQARGTLQEADQKERAFRAVHRALERMTGTAVSPVDAHRCAVATLRSYRGDIALAEKLPDLRAERKKAEELAARQADVRERAAMLASPDQPLNDPLDVDRARRTTSAAEAKAQEDVSREKANLESLQGAIQKLQDEVDIQQKRVDEHRRFSAVVEGVARRWKKSVETPADLSALLAYLQSEQVLSQRSVNDLEQEATALEARLQELRSMGGSFPHGLPEACERVGGRLLVERFEDVRVEDASETEARLGPLVNAILVEDSESAARELAEHPDTPPTVLLLNGREVGISPEDLPSGEVLGDSVAVKEGLGLRLSRLPASPLIGRQAREHVILGLEGQQRELDQTLTEARERQRLLKEDGDSIRALLPNSDLLTGPLPAELLATAERELREARGRKDASSARLQAATEKLEELGSRRLALEEVWPDATLLPPPEHAARATQLKTEVAAAAAASRRVESMRADQEILAGGLDDLRVPPLDEAGRAELEEQLTSAQRTRDAWLAPQADLESVKGDLEALGFADAEAKIRADEELLASLNAEVEEAEGLLEEARCSRDQHKQDEGDREKELRAAESELAGSRARLRAMDAEIEACGVEDASDEALRLAREASSAAIAKHDAAVSATKTAGNLLAGIEPRVVAAEAEVEAAIKERTEQEAQAGPAITRWEALQARCSDLGLLDAALGDDALEEVTGKASVDVFQLRQRWWALMLDRLQHATGGESLADALRLIAESTTEAGSEQYVRAWLDTRAWLTERVPKHVSEVEDPVEALRQLRRYLDRLVDKLGRYEHRLRGDSRDVARAIEGRLRKVNNLLTKLNRDLRGVGFGSIEAIRVKSEREKSMNSILSALSEPDQQGALFGPDMSIEEALDELFRRHGGRRDGGRRILDYREYLKLRVEARRNNSEEWEEVRDGAQMSTGEGIGVGAAIMMVVLTAWERDAALIRARRETGTLRFLFLDEANRLSLDNLEVLFDLCAALDLQLLAAAPEVATSSGNTTYTLQRTTDSQGREVVNVSGRRARRSN